MRNTISLLHLRSIGGCLILYFLFPFIFKMNGEAFAGHSVINESQDAKSDSANSTKAQKILMKAVEAAGGLESIKKIENFSIKTRNFITQTQTKTELIVTEIAQLPDKTKQIMKLPKGERIQVLDGNAGWKQIGPNVSDLSPAEIREMKKGLFRDTINIFKKSDSGKLELQYLSEETIAGKTNHVLQIKDHTGEFFNLYIDAKTFLISKKAYHGTSTVGLATLEEIYSDYQEADGIKLPFKIVVRANGRRFIESEVIEVKFNLELDEYFFLRK